MSAAPGTGARLRTGGLAAWSIHHPIGVTMITLALVVLGVFFSLRLPVDLLPNIVYPEIGVRILDPGVPARIMEDQVTRQLEEQLAITENVIAITSSSRDGASSIDLFFPYGIDIDVALRDASTRLDRAERFLPDTIDPPIVFKRDPQQVPVAEFVVSSSRRDAVALRSYVDYTFAKWFMNLPGVASTEVGGGLVREIQVLPNLERLAAVGLSLDALVEALRSANRDVPAGRLRTGQQEFTSRTAGRFLSIEDLRNAPIRVADGSNLPLKELAEVRDTHEDERLRVRFDGIAGVKLSVQKQPGQNTVAVVDTVMERLQWLRDNDLIPDDIEIHAVSDQSLYIRHALNNATLAGLSGATLAMLVVLLFLGDLRRTLVIGSAIPIAIAFTLFVMEFTGLTLNIMSLGGLAVGIGMLVDSSIVMLENIHRHQHAGEDDTTAGLTAAGEVNSAIVASTSTNLAAVLPFLLIGGLTGLLFRELIITISAAIFAAMLVSLTLIPAWASRLRDTARGEGPWRQAIDRRLKALQNVYANALDRLLQRRVSQALSGFAFLVLLAVSLPLLLQGRETFLPSMDDGSIRVPVMGDPGTTLEDMDRTALLLEKLFHGQPEVESVFTINGGFIFGRTQREMPSRATLQVQLKPVGERQISSDAWITRMNGKIEQLGLVGYKVHLNATGLRGLRIGSGDGDITIRIQGPDLDTLQLLSVQAMELLKDVPGLRNLTWSGEEVAHELAVRVDRERAAQLGLTVEDVGTAVQFALDGEIATDFIDGDRQFDVRVKLPTTTLATVNELEGTLLFGADRSRPAVYLSDVAKVELIAAPVDIVRDQQQRVANIFGSLTGERALNEVSAAALQRMGELKLPPGYRYYDAGAFTVLKEGRKMAGILLGLALFLVFVVMAVQYESLRNPLIILLSVPFAATGPAIVLPLLDAPLSMPVWLGLIMLAGIVVNNAIVLVEYIELMREQGMTLRAAITTAGRLRLRPILMTTLTTVFGLLPLSLGLGEGSEMLEPLGQTMVAGLSFSLLVSLVLVPVLYLWLHPERRA